MGGSIYGNYIGDLKCWPFSRPQQLRGVLLGGFESSDFYPGATTLEQVRNSRSKIWFESDVPIPASFDRAKIGLPSAYLLDVEGRFSLCDGWFGHQGQYPREFIVSRYYSATELPMR